LLGMCLTLGAGRRLRFSSWDRHCQPNSSRGGAGAREVRRGGWCAVYLVGVLSQPHKSRGTSPERVRALKQLRTRERRGAPKRPRQRALAVAAAAVPVICFGPAATSAGANVIYDGGFGHGLNGWLTKVLARGSQPGFPHVFVVHSPPEAVLKCNRAQRGHPYLQFDVPAGASAYVEQSIIVPVGAGRLTLRAWGDLEPVSAVVSIVNGTVPHPLRSFTPPLLRQVLPPAPAAAPAPVAAPRVTCSHRKPLFLSFDVSRWRGQAVGLRVRASGRGAAGTIADFDWFSLG
jgi:hypothetical protein